jgi:hypothetical protein
MGNNDKVNPLAALDGTDSVMKRDTLKLAFQVMDADERSTWEAVLDGSRLNARTGQPYSADHIVRALKAAGYNVSPAAVRRWRSNL